MRAIRKVAINSSLSPWVSAVALAVAACSGGEFRLAEELPLATLDPTATSPSAAGSTPEPIEETPQPSETQPEATTDAKDPPAAQSSSPAVSPPAAPTVEPEPTAPSEPVTPPASTTPDAGSSAPDDTGPEPTSDAGQEPDVDTDAGSPGPTTEPEPELEPFSFFVTSFTSMQALSGSDLGFGGDLRYGEATGLAGADKICSEIAEISMPGASAKGWRAFLSASRGPDGSRVDAIDRIGEGPWYDRLGRLVAADLDELLEARPGGDEAVSADLPNEFGESNRVVAGVETAHQDVLTGSDEDGELSGQTCADWTSTMVPERPRAGHSYGSDHWIDANTVPGCAASVGNGDGGFWGSGPGGWGWSGSPYVPGGGVGDNGGYGAIYCFALSE